MLHMCVYMHSHFVENHPIWVLEDGPLISEVVLSHEAKRFRFLRKNEHIKFESLANQQNKFQS
jgi:hypothetical protein